MNLNSSVQPQSPSSSRINTSKKQPSSDPRKKRQNACPDNDYVATKSNDDNKLICDDGTDDMYFHQSQFDKSINNKSSFPKGVWCCEKDKIYSTQTKKRNEALERKHSLFMREHEERKEKSVKRRLPLHNQNFEFSVPSLPQHNTRYTRPNTSSSHTMHHHHQQIHHPIENNSSGSFESSMMNEDFDWKPLLYSTPPREHNSRKSPRNNTTRLKNSQSKNKK